MIETTLENFINGEFSCPSGGQYVESFNPSTGHAYARLPDSCQADVDMAVQAAQCAFPSWSQTSRHARHDWLMSIAHGIEARLEEFARAESKDQGKPVSLAMTVDIPRAIYNFRFFAGRILYLEDKKTDLDGVAMSYTHRDPVGVAGLISPWNLPLHVVVWQYLLTWKIAPAIAAGNTCVCKPSELTSMTAYLLCTVLKDIGLPKGVVNMVFGTGPKAGNVLVTHPDVPLISFTGGTATGELIMRNSAPYCKKLSLELGGKNPNIIFEDANLDECIATTVRSSFANQGEICLCGSRIFVHESLYETFLQRFSHATQQLVVGDPSDPQTTTGALVSDQHLQKVMSYIELARQEGGTIVCGGHRLTHVVGVHGEDLSRGYFLQPTIIATHALHCEPGQPRSCWMDPLKSRVVQEEIFGPVVTVTPFESEEQVLTWANGVKYGLSASIWTENGRRQRRVAEKLRVGTVWVNCWMVRDLNMPFGGTKMSGIGREGGTYSMEFFTEEKTICLKN